MKIFITGSYRPDEDFGFVQGMQSEFATRARQMGRSVAEFDHTLCFTWSDHNRRSQLGEKNIAVEGRNHPYDETADFHAVCGFLDYAASAGVPSGDARLRVIISGPRAEFVAFFPSLLGPLAQTWTDLVARGRITIEVVESEAPLLRSHLLGLTGRMADIVIAVGGGKATTQLLQDPEIGRKAVPLHFAGGASQRVQRSPELTSILQSFQADAVTGSIGMALSGQNLARMLVATSA